MTGGLNKVLKRRRICLITGGDVVCKPEMLSEKKKSEGGERCGRQKEWAVGQTRPDSGCHGERKDIRRRASEVTARAQQGQLSYPVWDRLLITSLRHNLDGCQRTQ